MQFRINQCLPASRAQVEDAFLDPRFIERQRELPALGTPKLLEQQREGRLIRQRVRYSFTGELSTVARRMIDPRRLTWVEESVFDPSEHRTAIRIVPDHYRDRLASRMTVRFEEDHGCTCRQVEGEVLVHMPFVARKVEGAIISGLKEHAELQMGVLARWLRS